MIFQLKRTYLFFFLELLIIDLQSSMKIFVKDLAGKVFSLECESTDTIAHLQAKVHAIEGIPPRDQRYVFFGKLLGCRFSENMTLAGDGIKEGSVLYLVGPLYGGGGGEYVVLHVLV